MLMACRNTPRVQPALVATRFVQALNARDLDAMVADATLPFTFTTQMWESASDGSGFVLGAAEMKVADSPGALAGLLKDVVGRVRIEGTAPVISPPSQAELFRDPLEQEASWSGLELVVFLRGQEDVEHIAIVGVQAATGKIRAMYLN